MSGWYLQQVSIEGFRGINNQGAPLLLKFSPEHVNSVSAPNGVGKTSIFDAVAYAITGNISKLDELPAAENGSSYYLNLFHSGRTGTIILTLLPAEGGDAVTITVKCGADGARSVSATEGTDGTAILAELNREFVLLDGKTFQNFIDLTPQKRGRSFTGLLGLKRYSAVRQTLAGLAHTRAFNNHFGIAEKNRELDSAKVAAERIRANIGDAYKTLVGEDYDPADTEAEMLAKAHSALYGIALLKPLCEGHTFQEIDLTACVETVKAAEGGEAREKLVKIIREQERWSEALDSAPSPEDIDNFVSLGRVRDEALKLTQGDVFRQLYALSESILTDSSWEDVQVCPTCERSGSNSVLDHVRSKAAAFNAVEAASNKLTEAWTRKGWNQLDALEKAARKPEEPPLLATTKAKGAEGNISGDEAFKIASWVKILVERATAKLDELNAAKLQVEKILPEKLTAVVEQVEAARRLQTNLKDLHKTIARCEAVTSFLSRIARVKRFLDKASNLFASAESAASARRIAAIEPKACAFFKSIMCSDIVPALKKRGTSEDLSISLAKFWTLTGISAQAVLSESYRNAFAISVYLAAASLYGGAAKFLILDDVTSSFDSGHQFHLMNVIKSQVARPAVLDGPQVILLSHDPILEKLFNASMNEGGWHHQRIMGTACTSIFPKDGAAKIVRDTTLEFINSGNTDDAALRIRQYLELKLNEIICKVNIPIPHSIVFSDDTHMANNLIKAIKNAIDLYQAAGRLILPSAQISTINTLIAIIVGNYLSHWSTGQAQAFTASALKGVMQTIDDFARCFQFENPVGSGQYCYYRSLSR